MIKIKDLCEAIEAFAPRELQENYDNAGLQTGNPETEITSVLICLDVTEDIINEAMERGCNIIVSHHPLIFKGLKHITGETPVERAVIASIRNNIAIYSAHTNLDSAREGVSHEMAQMLNLKEVQVLDPKTSDGLEGLGILGFIKPTPKIEFLRKVKDIFGVKCLRYSAVSPQLVVRKVAVCGGAGASLISEAIKAKADVMLTGDVKYHDFTTFGSDIIIADVGHFEGELCSEKIIHRIIKERFPDLEIYISSKESNPVNYI